MKILAWKPQYPSSGGQANDLGSLCSEVTSGNNQPEICSRRRSSDKRAFDQPSGLRERSLCRIELPPPNDGAPRADSRCRKGRVTLDARRAISQASPIRRRSDLLHLWPSFSEMSKTSTPTAPRAEGPRGRGDDGSGKTQLGTPRNPERNNPTARGGRAMTNPMPAPGISTGSAPPVGPLAGQSKRETLSALAGGCARKGRRRRGSKATLATPPSPRFAVRGGRSGRNSVSSTASASSRGAVAWTLGAKAAREPLDRRAQRGPDNRSFLRVDGSLPGSGLSYAETMRVGAAGRLVVWRASSAAPSAF